MFLVKAQEVQSWDVISVIDIAIEDAEIRL